MVFQQAVVDARPHDFLLTVLDMLARDVGRTQGSFGVHQIEMERDEPCQHGKSITELENQRDQARVNLREFLDELTDDEINIITIICGNRNWQTGYEDLLDPEGYALRNP